MMPQDAGIGRSGLAITSDWLLLVEGKGFSMNYLSVFPLCCLNNVREETACCYCLSAWNQTVT